MSTAEIETLVDVRNSDADEWTYYPSETRYGVDKWIHESGAVLAVRGISKTRLTLHPPHDDPRTVAELDSILDEDATFVAKVLIDS